MLGSVKAFRVSALISVIIFASGCTEIELVAHGAKQIRNDDITKEVGEYKIGKPYQINGVWYYPKLNYNYDETGIASWYGPGFHGRRTANGAVFDENKVSGAHKTLQLPSIARVTNLENGRSIKVLINDRGPYAHGRIIDLSRRAAQLLDIERKGTARVRVQVLETESRQVAALAQGNETVASSQTPAAAPTQSVTAEILTPTPSGSGAETNAQTTQTAQAASNGSNATVPVGTIVPPSNQVVEQQPVRDSQLFVQAGAFTVFDNANKLRAQLSTLGPSLISPALVNGQQFFRVRVGPMASVQQADEALERLIASGYSESRIVVD